SVTRDMAGRDGDVAVMAGAEEEAGGAGGAAGRHGAGAGAHGGDHAAFQGGSQQRHAPARPARLPEPRRRRLRLPPRRRLREGDVEESEPASVGLNFPQRNVRSTAGDGVVLLRPEGHQRRIRRQLPQPHPHRHLHHRRRAPGRAPLPRRLGQQDEAPRSCRGRRRHHGRQPLQGHPSPAAAPPAVLPRQPPRRLATRRPRHGHRHAFPVRSCVSYALWFVVQAKVAKVFPSRYWATALTCVGGSLQSAVAAAVAVVLAPAGDGHEWARTWTLRWDLQLATVVYSGVFNTGVTFVLVSWAVERRGPIYPPMFNSLSLVATTAVDAVVLGTDVYLGGVLGAALVVVDLYAFLWGKSKELAAAKAVNAEQEL
uniref:WAT1-related protein n=1 Tax=Aegilops tauschii subsp. strangulata TaxID=200361 RepID=A0A453JS23_AEGTS